MNRLEELREELQVKSEQVVGKEMLDYCIAWLTNHIRVTDVVLPFLSEHQRKMVNCCISPEVLQNNSVLFLSSKVLNFC